MMHAGMSLAERKAQRQAYIDRAIQSAKLTGMSLRCQGLQYDLRHLGHQICRGEDPGNGGCLCECHDNPGAEIIASSIEPAP
jgi:hypothetical protein